MKTIIFRQNVKFLPFSGNTTRGFTKLGLHLQFLLYSNTVRCNTSNYQQLWTNLIYLKSPQKSKTYILGKLDPLKAAYFTGYISIPIMGYNNYKIRNFAKLRALLVRRSCNMPFSFPNFIKYRRHNATYLQVHHWPTTWVRKFDNMFILS